MNRSHDDRGQEAYGSGGPTMGGVLMLLGGVLVVVGAFMPILSFGFVGSSGTSIDLLFAVLDGTASSDFTVTVFPFLIVVGGIVVAVASLLYLADRRHNRSTPGMVVAGAVAAGVGLALGPGRAVVESQSGLTQVSLVPSDGMVSVGWGFWVVVVGGLTSIVGAFLASREGADLDIAQLTASEGSISASPLGRKAVADRDQGLSTASTPMVEPPHVHAQEPRAATTEPNATGLAPSPPSDEANGVSCPACGAGLQPHARFCHACGLEVASGADPERRAAPSPPPPGSPVSAPQPARGRGRRSRWVLAVVLVTMVLALATTTVAFLVLTGEDAYACEPASSAAVTASGHDIEAALEARFGPVVGAFPHVGDASQWSVQFEGDPPSPGDAERVLRESGQGDWEVVAMGLDQPEWLLLRASGTTPIKPSPPFATVFGRVGAYQIVATDEQPVTPEILEQTCTIIANRLRDVEVDVALLEVIEPDLIRVFLWSPADDNERDVRALIGTTGVFEFLPIPAAFSDEVLPGAPLPEGMAVVEPLFNGVQIANTRIGQDQTTGEILLELELKDIGARRLDEYAEAHLGEQFAIVLDGVVQSAPTIDARSFGGRAQLKGNFARQDLVSLATVLKHGSLPLEVREVGFSSFFQD